MPVGMHMIVNGLHVIHLQWPMQSIRAFRRAQKRRFYFVPSKGDEILHTKALAKAREAKIRDDDEPNITPSIVYVSPHQDQPSAPHCNHKRHWYQW